MEQELLTLPDHLSSPPVFNRVRVTPSWVLCVILCRLFFSFWPLCSLSFFDLRILISPLVSSNISFTVVSVRNIYTYEKYTSMHTINIHFTVVSIKHIYTYRRHTSHFRINKKHQNTDSRGANCIIVFIADTTENEYKDTCFLQLIENIRQWLNFPIHQFLTDWLIVGDWWWVDFFSCGCCFSYCTYLKHTFYSSITHKETIKRHQIQQCGILGRKNSDLILVNWNQ